MYQPLVSPYHLGRYIAFTWFPVSKLAIFREIENTTSTYDTRSFHRQAVCTSERKLHDEGQNFTSDKPDFVFMEMPATQLTAIGATDRLLRRCVSSFVEIKAEESDRPRPSRPGMQNDVVKPLTAQAADYAGLILMSRPFHLFAIGMVIFGSKFSVGYFDHAGILFSLEYDIFKDLDVLVRVIRRITCDMSLVDLGHDRLATLLDRDTYYQEQYPRFKVRMGGRDTRCWVTEGLPMWVSHSLFGRGTSVWHVKIVSGTMHTTKRAVLKVAWRSRTRDPESDIYSTIKGYGGHPGVAEFLDGGDVMFPVAGQLAIPVSIQDLRNPRYNQPLRTVEDNQVLHRVLINPVGRGLWTFKSEKEFICALLSALAGEFTLFDLVLV
jgi:hypothetical protein